MSSETELGKDARTTAAQDPRAELHAMVLTAVREFFTNELRATLEKTFAEAAYVREQQTLSIANLDRAVSDLSARLQVIEVERNDIYMMEQERRNRLANRSRSLDPGQHPNGACPSHANGMRY